MTYWTLIKVVLSIWIFIVHIMEVIIQGIFLIIIDYNHNNNSYRRSQANNNNFKFNNLSQHVFTLSNIKCGNFGERGHTNPSWSEKKYFV